jgi:hypothetical protein
MRSLQSDTEPQVSQSGDLYVKPVSVPASVDRQCARRRSDERHILAARQLSHADLGAGRLWSVPLEQSRFQPSRFRSAYASFAQYINIKFTYAGYFTDPGTAPADLVVTLDGSGLFFSNPAVIAEGFFPNPSLASSLLPAVLKGSYTTAPGDIWFNVNLGALSRSILALADLRRFCTKSATHLALSTRSTAASRGTQPSRAWASQRSIKIGSRSCRTTRATTSRRCSGTRSHQ